MSATGQTSCARCGSAGRHLKTRSRSRGDGTRSTLTGCVRCGTELGVLWTEHRPSAAAVAERVTCTCTVGAPEGPCPLHRSER